MEDKFVKSHAFAEGATEDLLHLLEGYGLVRAIITEVDMGPGRWIASAVWSG